MSTGPTKAERLARQAAREPGSQGAREPGSQGAREPGSQAARQPGSQAGSWSQVAAVEAARAAMARLCAGDYPEQAWCLKRGYEIW